MTNLNKCTSQSYLYNWRVTKHKKLLKGMNSSQGRKSCGLPVLCVYNLRIPVQEIDVGERSSPYVDVGKPPT